MVKPHQHKYLAQQQTDTLCGQSNDTHLMWLVNVLKFCSCNISRGAVVSPFLKSGSTRLIITSGIPITLFNHYNFNSNSENVTKIPAFCDVT